LFSQDGWGITMFECTEKGPDNLFVGSLGKNQLTNRDFVKMIDLFDRNIANSSLNVPYVPHNKTECAQPHIVNPFNY
jgi:hypothetical protein